MWGDGNLLPVHLRRRLLSPLLRLTRVIDQDHLARMKYSGARRYASILVISRKSNKHRAGTGVSKENNIHLVVRAPSRGFKLPDHCLERHWTSPDGPQKPLHLRIKSTGKTDFSPPSPLFSSQAEKSLHAEQESQPELGYALFSFKLICIFKP